MKPLRLFRKRSLKKKASTLHKDAAQESTSNKRVLPKRYFEEDERFWFI